MLMVILGTAKLARAEGGAVEYKGKLSGERGLEW